MIQFRCPQCGRAIVSAEDAAGQTAICPNAECGAVLTVPPSEKGEHVDEDRPESENPTAKAVFDPDLFSTYQAPRASSFLKPAIAQKKMQDWYRRNAATLGIALSFSWLVLLIFCDVLCNGGLPAKDQWAFLNSWAFGYLFAWSLAFQVVYDPAAGRVNRIWQYRLLRVAAFYFLIGGSVCLLTILMFTKRTP
jgi:hypothetical protein